MDEIKTLLTTRINTIGVLAESATKYFKRISDVVLGVDPDQHAHFLSAVKMMESAPATLKQALTGEPIKALFDAYESFSTIRDNITSITRVLENQKFLSVIIYNMSETYVTEVQRERMRMLDLIEKYHESEIVDDERVYSLAEKALKPNNNVGKILLFLDEHETTINKFVIFLCRMTLPHTTGSQLRRIESMIEHYKNHMLGSTRVNLDRLPAPQAAVSRYRLVPADTSKPPEEVFDGLGLKWNKKQSLEENAQAAGCVILMDISSRSAIEFDIRGLINREYVEGKGLAMNAKYGLNKKNIERLRTTIDLPVKHTSAGKVQKFILPKTTHVYVLQTLNGEVWRPMMLDGETKIPIEYIRGLIDGVSTRAWMYNRIQEDELLAKCLDPKADAIIKSFEEEKRTLPPSDAIKAPIVTDLTEWMQEQLEKKLPKKHEVRTLFMASPIDEVIADKLVRIMGVNVKGSAEYAVTYLTRIDDIVREFRSALESKYNEGLIPATLFRDLPENDLRKQILSVYKGCISSAADELDRRQLWAEYDFTLKEYFMDKKYAIV